MHPLREEEDSGVRVRSCPFMSTGTFRHDTCDPGGDHSKNGYDAALFLSLTYFVEPYSTEWLFFCFLFYFCGDTVFLSPVGNPPPLGTALPDDDKTSFCCRRRRVRWTTLSSKSSCAAAERWTSGTVLSIRLRICPRLSGFALTATRRRQRCLFRWPFFISHCYPPIVAFWVARGLEGSPYHPPPPPGAFLLELLSRTAFSTPAARQRPSDFACSHAVAHFATEEDDKHVCLLPGVLTPAFPSPGAL